MKKFTKILICLILCVFTIGLAACGNNNPSGDGFPIPSGATISNGGLVVRKGEYVYFVNGYQSADSMNDKNASYTIGALMVAKLDDNGQIVLNDNNLLHDDYHKTMSDKLGGFEATNLYIMGDYLYFVSPCQQDDTSETWAKQRVDFFRIKLDKSSSVEQIYQSTVNNSELEYAYYKAGSNVYLMVYEKNTSLDDDSKSNVIYRINVGSKNIDEIDRDVSSLILPNTGENTEDYKNIYYIKDDTSNVSNIKYTLVRYNVNNNEKSINKNFSAQPTLMFEHNGYVFFKDSSDCLQRANESELRSNSYTFVCYADLYTKIVLMPSGEGVICISGASIEYYIIGNRDPKLLVKDNDASSVTLIGLSNGCVVYIDNANIIKKVSYANRIQGQTVNIEMIATISDIDTTYFDIAGGYLYFFKTVGNNKYLHRIIIDNTSNTEIVDEMLGVYLSDDIPETKEEEEE